jgi:iron complex outermembrane recepter protein
MFLRARGSWAALVVLAGLHRACLAADSADVEQIVVTGSRIPDSPVAPVVFLDRTDLERGGLDSIGKVLQQLPANTGSPLNTNVNNAGDGSTRIDLRGLDPKRTLVLLNGRRLPNGGLGADSSVDLDMLPLSMIDHVEVLTSGAAAVYGADAVGGVVNLITPAHLDGLSLRATRSAGDDGDAGATKVQATFGAETRGLGWILGVDHTQQQGITADRRAYSALPQQILDENGTIGYLGSFQSGIARFLVPDGNLLDLTPGQYTRVPGATGQTAADYRAYMANPSNTFNFAPYTYLQTPNRRTSVWLQGSLPLDSGVSLFVEGLWHSRHSSQMLAPTPYGSLLDGGPVLADGSTGIPANNYYNPFGVDLGLAVRRLVEDDNRGYQEDVSGWRAVSGARGTLGGWHWQFAVAYATSDAATHESGAISDTRLFNALGPSGPNGSGTIVCGEPDSSGVVPAANIVPGCVPVNLFGNIGTITPQQIAYIGAPFTDHGLNEQRLVNFDVQGDWLALPAGPIAWATGFEYREERGRYVFDPLRIGGVTGAPLSVDVPGGSIDSRDLYVEMRAPLAREGSSRALDLDVGARYADYSSFGGRIVWQAGLRWQPESAVRLRLDYAQVFRAPSLDETFEAHASSLGLGAFDPCGNDPTPAQQVSCAAHGVPGGSYAQAADDEFITSTGGNPRISPEHGGTFDGGIDVALDAAHAHLTVDYFRTRIDGFISEVSADQILEECADHGSSSACGSIRRNADGSVQSVIATEQNFGREVVSGIDTGARATFQSRIGTWSLGALATYLARHDAQPFAGGIVEHEAGTYSRIGQAFPRWRSLAHVDWQRNGWHASYGIQVIGDYTECGAGPNEDLCHRVAGVVYQDISGGFSWGSRIALGAGISNLTNRYPPFVNNSGNANTDPATYRLLGRTFFVDLRCGFP